MPARMIRLSPPEVPLEAARKRIGDVLDSGWLTNGHQVVAFEEALAARLGVRHVVAVSSGTGALHLMLVAVGVKPGDEVIVPGYTFPATAASVVHAGAEPVVVDVLPGSANIDPAAVAAAITARTRAVMPVHQFGLACDWDAVAAAAPGKLLVEDAACALGARFGGRACGQLGVAAAFSFHPRKMLTTAEGGAIATDHDGLAAELRLLRNHGMEVEGGVRRFRLPGYNFRLSEIHAALGLSQLEGLDAVLDARRQVAGWYAEALAGLPLDLPPDPATAPHTFQTYAVFLRQHEATAVIAHLIRAGIEAGHGAEALATLGLYRTAAPTPVALDFRRRHVALPLHSKLTHADVKTVAAALSEALA